MIQKKWNIRDADPEEVKKLGEKLPHTRKSLCALFVSRGFNTYDKVKQYFTSSLHDLHNPGEMKGMVRAVDRLLKAFHHEEKILLVGDYDVDGTASVAVMYRFLSRYYSKQNVFYYIPDRYREGYGLSREAVEYGVSKNVNIIMTLDCGITSVKLINEASRVNEIDFIICDHHLPGNILPAAFEILNPKQPGCGYPFKELCGCGVAFKLVRAVGKRLKLPADFSDAYLDLLTLATGADLVPVVDENRILCHFGLQKINRQPVKGIEALKEILPDCPSYTLEKVVFSLAPKINAAGRMAHGSLAVELFTEDDPQRAANLAKKLIDLNDQRKETDMQVTREALKMIEEDGGGSEARAIVVWGERWHKGVLGIVASRLAELFYKPAVVMTMDKDTLTGSARSVPGFNVYNAIYACRELLTRFGGHASAAGITLPRENVAPFRQKFMTVVGELIQPVCTVPQINIDAEIKLSDIDYPFYNTIKRMEPFGQGNPMPVFMTRRIYQSRSPRIVGENHVLFSFRNSGKKSIRGIGFGLKEKFEILRPQQQVDIVYNIVENDWNDRKALQLRVIDFKVSDPIQPDES